MIENKKAAIFDWDGTLVDSMGIWNKIDKILIKQIAGVNVDEDTIGFFRDKMLASCRGDANPYLSYCVFLREKYNVSISAEKIHDLRYTIADSYLSNVVTYKAGVKKVLDILKNCGLILAIATTTKKTNMDIYRRRNENIKRRASIDQYFSAVYVKEDVKNIKPDPEVYIKTMKKLQLEPKECLAFEDSLSGAQAAKAAGIDLVYMYDKFSAKDREKITALADYQFSDFRELYEAVHKELETKI